MAAVRATAGVPTTRPPGETRPQVRQTLAGLGRSRTSVFPPTVLRTRRSCRAVATLGAPALTPASVATGGTQVSLSAKGRSSLVADRRLEAPSPVVLAASFKTATKALFTSTLAVVAPAGCLIRLQLIEVRTLLQNLVSSCE